MSEAENDGASLLDVLNRLVTALEPPRDGAPVLEARRGAVPERWEDGDYFYVEANLAGVPESDIDISIHGGLVFIRIVRWVARARSAGTVDSRELDADVPARLDAGRLTQYAPTPGRMSDESKR